MTLPVLTDDMSDEEIDAIVNKATTASGFLKAISHEGRLIKAPDALARFIAPKGSVALNGTSLTVNDVEKQTFGINLVPHTKTVTTWGDVQVGDAINLEIDTLARYVARLADYQG